ncbi:MAG: AAA family ATPase, partial [Bacteroidales bacterium]|nr:AAA family ATPase [Bacteroidales bacterium]
MIKRILQINNELDGSIFLFGARQTGKTTALLMQFPNAIYIDLLDTDIKNRYMRRPAILYELLQDKPEQTLVIIDEIAEVPELLNEVHRLIVRCNHIFIHCGSSARKLKRKGRNTLGG